MNVIELAMTIELHSTSNIITVIIVYIIHISQKYYYSNKTCAAAIIHTT